VSASRESAAVGLSRRAIGAALSALAIPITFVVGLAAISVSGMPTLWEPVAIAGLGSGRIAVLSKNGDLDLVTAGVRKPITQMRGSTVLDLAAITGNGSAYTVLVSSVRRSSTGDVVGMLDVVPSRQALRSTGTIYSGVVLKTGSQLAGFAANSRGQRIETLSVSGQQILTSTMATIPEVNAMLGALAMDPSGADLYVADLNFGNLWRVPTAGGKPSLFATGLRDIRALAADSRWVFVADGDGRRILQFAQNAPPKASRQTAASAKSLQLAEFKSPSAVTVITEGQIAVGDPVAGAVFLVNVSDGRVVSTIH
jgi:hypothetical protein